MKMMLSKKAKLEEKLSKLWGKPKDAGFKLGLIEHYFRKIDIKDFFQTISDRTMNDIDFPEVFAFIDRTTSSIGQQYLYAKLLTISKYPDFDEQERIIQYFSSNQEDRLKTQAILSRLSDEKSYYISWLFLEDFIKPPWYFAIIKALSVISLLFFVSCFIIPSPAIFILMGLFAINMGFHYANKKFIEMYSVSIPRLAILVNCVKDLLKIRLPMNSMDVIDRSVRSIAQLNKRLSIFTIEANQNMDPITGFVYLLIEYIKIQFLLEPIIVFNVLKKLHDKRSDIRLLFDFFGKLDSYISILSLRNGLSYFCLPYLSEDVKQLSCTDIYHPLVSNCTPNSIDTGGKSILLTGSNMSGKTTFIRSIAINSLTAQTINTCFAKRYNLPAMKLLSAIRISDDVLSGKSYYFEEVLTIHEMVHESKSGNATIFLLDEIFKGTNTIERIASGKAVLSYLCRNGNLVFVSTHDIELTDLLSESYELYHFTEMVIDNKVHFDYKIKNGALSTRNAIRILEISKYPAEIIEEARKVSNKIAKQESARQE